MLAPMCPPGVIPPCSTLLPGMVWRHCMLEQDELPGNNKKPPSSQGRKGAFRGTTLIGACQHAGELPLIADNGAQPASATGRAPLRAGFHRCSSQASSALCGVPCGRQSPGFHLVFPGSLQGWLTTPVRSLSICRSGPGGIRTLDPHNAIVMRSQLRYGPNSNFHTEYRIATHPLCSTPCGGHL